jgi:hypothetical protein
MLMWWLSRARPMRDARLLHRHLNATTVHQLTFGRLDVGGTRLRLRALHVMGHGSARISRALGVREETIQRLVRGDARTISPQLRDAIADLYDDRAERDPAGLAPGNPQVTGFRTVPSCSAPSSTPSLSAAAPWRPGIQPGRSLSWNCGTTASAEERQAVAELSQRAGLGSRKSGLGPAEAGDPVTRRPGRRRKGHGPNGRGLCGRYVLRPRGWPGRGAGGQGGIEQAGEAAVHVVLAQPRVALGALDGSRSLAWLIAAMASSLPGQPGQPPRLAGVAGLTSGSRQVPSMSRRVRAFRTALASPSLLKYARVSASWAAHSRIRSAHQIRSVSL